MEKENNYKWTAIFLLRGVEDTETYMFKIIKKLLKIKKSVDLSIILCINVKAEKLPSDYPRGEDAPLVGWTTIFYSLITNEKGNCSLTLIKENKNFDIRDQKDVEGVFKNIILSQFIAKEYLLFTMDHGQPFGIFSGEEGEPEIRNAENPLVIHFKLLNEYPDLQKSIRSSLTEQSANILTITELRNAIEWAFGRKKIAVVAMLNCNLQFFDTGYELSNCVEYLVAFETHMYFADPYCYKAVLESLSCYPKMQSKEIAKLIVSTFGYNSDIKSKKSKTDVALFANDLSWYPSIAKQIDELSKKLIQELPRYFYQIQAAIEKCEYITPNIAEFCLIDFKNFIHCLYSQAPSLFEGSSYEIINNLLSQTVVESYIGSNFKMEVMDSFKAHSCFSIYLPKDTESYRESFGELYMRGLSEDASEFSKMFRWQTFITKYNQYLKLSKANLSLLRSNNFEKL